MPKLQETLPNVSIRSQINLAVSMASDDSTLLESLRQILSGTNHLGANDFVFEMQAAQIVIGSAEESIRIRSQSFEGRLLKKLLSGPASKAMLIAKLWPAQSPSESLDNRLHRLVSRLNKKIPGLIQFDGAGYRLGPNRSF